jgi:hypothetical protein
MSNKRSRLIVIDPEDTATMRSEITVAAKVAIQEGSGVVIVDPSEEETMRLQISDAAEQGGRDFFCLSREGPDTYMLPWGYQPHALAEVFLPSGRDTKRRELCRRYLTEAIAALQAADVHPNLRLLARALDPDCLEEVLLDMPASQCRARARALEYLHSCTEQELTEATMSLSSSLERLFFGSDFWQWIDQRRADGRRFSLLGALSKKAVVYYRPPHSENSSVITALFTQDLLRVLDAPELTDTRTLVAITGFAGISPQGMLGLVMQSREPGTHLVIPAELMCALLEEYDCMACER